MKNVLVTGATGMVGGLALGRCLARKDVGKVTCVTRRETGVEHPKLVEIVHEDFLDYTDVVASLKNQDVCIYCIGVYSGQVPREQFRTITVDYTKAVAEALKANNEKLTFCFLSGQGADPSGKSRMAFAKDKGEAENFLLGLGFENVHVFRPGYIYPVTPRQEPNFSYKIMRPLYRAILSRVYPNIGVASERLAAVMVDVGLRGGDKTVYENADLRNHDLPPTPHPAGRG